MSDFMTQLIAGLKQQFESFDIYSKICGKCGISTAKDIERTVESADWAALPAISDRMYKRSAGLFGKLKYNLPGVWHVSSSTSGDPSYVWRTVQDEQSIIKAYASCYRKPKQMFDISLAFAPGIGMLEGMSMRFDLGDGNKAKMQTILPTIAAVETTKQNVEMIKLGPSAEPRPALEINTKDLQEALAKAAAENLSVLFGASVIFIDQVLRSGAPLPNTKDVYIITGGGGWDGSKGAMQAKPIDRAAFVENACIVLGIPTSEADRRIWDNYGVTEKAFSCIGHWDSARKDYIYSTENLEPETKVIALDLQTGELVRDGKGIIRIISPHGNNGAATAVMQESDEINVISTNQDGSVKEFVGIKRIPMKDIDGTETADKIGCAGHLGNVEIK
ncbi:MAG: hypothetical protein JW839_04720 [Candidatus Lokiarchaeota archaeon]|nr:hypothetical protein [Candidatus Lokiarchaeota archaeon]